MSDTIFDMEYVHVDNLNADQVMEKDLIEVEGEIVQILSISPLRHGYVFTYENEYGEKDLVEVDDYSTFKLFVMQ